MTLKVRKNGGWALAVAWLVLTGCGSDPQLAADPNGSAGRRYAVSTGLLVADEFVGYLATVPSLDVGSSLDLDRAIEIEPSWIFGKSGVPSVYAASLLSPTIVRYDLGADGNLLKGDTVSFANYGVQSAYLAQAAPLYSDEKSYFIDDVQDQVVIWNPHAMQAIGTIALGNQDEAGLPPASEGSLVIHDGLILTITHWSDANLDSSQYGSHVRLIAIDPKTDQIVSRVDDSRLTYAVPQGRASDGSLYYSPNSYVAAQSEVGPGHGSPSRVLRVGPMASAFDADYDLDLSALVGGRPAGDFSLIDEQTALIRAWHPELVDPVTKDSWQDVLYNEAGFLWWRWHIGDSQATQIPNQSPGALGGSLFSLDAKTYVVRTSEDGASTTLDEIDAQGEFRPAFTGPGQFIGQGVVRLR